MADRVAIRQEFASDSSERIILIAMTQTMSSSVNELVAANHAIFMSPPISRVDYEQACGRLDRIGQRNPVTFWEPIANGTVETITYQSHSAKASLSDAILDWLRA